MERDVISSWLLDLSYIVNSFLTCNLGLPSPPPLSLSFLQLNNFKFSCISSFPFPFCPFLSFLFIDSFSQLIMLRWRIIAPIWYLTYISHCTRFLPLFIWHGLIDYGASAAEIAHNFPNYFVSFYTQRLQWWIVEHPIYEDILME